MASMVYRWLTGRGSVGTTTVSPYVTTRVYGWKPDTYDPRDKIHCFVIATNDIPETVDLRSKCPLVYDQKNCGSCTANAIAGAIQFDEILENLPNQTAPSRLFIYYNERVARGTTDTDSGATIRDSVNAVAKDGYCSESMWPYEVAKFAEKPSSACYVAAENHKAIVYMRVAQTAEQIRSALALGYPVVFGIMVYQSFEKPEITRTGIISMPTAKETILGGHAIVAVGYNKNYVIFRNSWGAEWGDAGYGYLPWEYIMNPKLASDFWTVRRVS